MLWMDCGAQKRHAALWKGNCYQWVISEPLKKAVPKAGPNTIAKFWNKTIYLIQHSLVFLQQLGRSAFRMPQASSLILTQQVFS